MSRKHQVSRRRMMQASFTTGVGLALMPRTAFAAAQDEDHFVLHVHVPEGMDCSYLFDARPVSMTVEDKLIQNYLKRDGSNRREPFVWKGRNGNQTLATDLVKPLLPFKDRLSIVNGVHMFPNFDGHEQNANFLFAGNPFGGDFYLPDAFRDQSPPLGYFQLGSIGLVSLSNTGKGVSFSNRDLQPLTRRLQQFQHLKEESTLYRFVRRRSEVLGQGKGKFSAGARAMRESFVKSTDLADKLSKLEFENEEKEGDLAELNRSLSMVFELWRKGLTNRVALGIEMDEVIDTHDARSASEQEELYKKVVENYVAILSRLRDTEFKDGRSFLGVTTVMITTEFSRTMRQLKRPIDETGTDHNPLNNSFLLVGKGIKGGVVVGSSDFAKGDEVLSKAHLARDKDRLKIMGRPFDFKKQRIRNDLPETYRTSDYVTSNNVINTVLAATRGDTKFRRLTERNGLEAPVLTDLLA